VPPWEEGVQTSRRVVPVPHAVPAAVRRADPAPDTEPAQPVSAPAAPSTGSVGTALGDFWFETVSQLVREETVAALVRELALQSQLVAREADQWRLRVDRETLNQPSARERLSLALQSLGHDVRLLVDMGTVTDSPALRTVAEAARRQREAEAQLLSDPFVQAMMRDFGGKIVPGSIKPLAA
jgi:DNA polymerase III subunit gamma/tau